MTSAGFCKENDGADTEQKAVDGNEREKGGQQVVARFWRVLQAKERSFVFLLRAQKAVVRNGCRGEQIGQKTESKVMDPW